MKTRFLHIVNVTLLFLIVLYSTPVAFLHNCSRFNEHHSSAVIEKPHTECYLCDIKITTFLSSSVLQFAFLAAFICLLGDFFVNNDLNAFKWPSANKGPPVPVLI